MMEFDLAVIGGGQAGLAAAHAAAMHGARTALFDEGIEPGGELRFRIDTLAVDSAFMTAPQAARRLTEAAQGAGVALFPSTIVWGLYPGFVLGVSGQTDAHEIRAKRVVLATGATDLAMSFPGSDLPGVMTGRGLLRLLHLHRVWPGGKRVAIIGDDPFAGEVAQCVELAGGSVVARVAKEPIVTGADGMVASILVGDDAIVTDLVVICAGNQPDISLALMIECETGHSSTLGGFTLKLSQTLSTSVEGLFACGGVAGNGTLDEHLAEGQLAGLSVAASLGFVPQRELDTAVGQFAARFPERAAAASGVRAGWRQHFVESVHAAGDV